MQVRGFVATAMLCALAVSGCVADDGDFEGEEERVSPFSGEFWEWSPNRPGNGDLEVYEGDDTDTPDCLIWDIDSAGVARQHEQTGELIDSFVVAANEIYGADPATGAAAALNCTAVEGDHPSGKVYNLVSAEGEVVLTLWNRYVFLGDVHVPSVADPTHGNLLQNQVAFSFKKDHIYAGPWWQGNVVGTADAKIEFANPMRRLLLGALVTGECGGEGLP